MYERSTERHCDHASTECLPVYSTTSAPAKPGIPLVIRLEVALLVLLHSLPRSLKAFLPGIASVSGGLLLAIAASTWGLLGHSLRKHVFCVGGECNFFVL